MASPFEDLYQLERTEDFARLPYQAQIELRRRWLEKHSEELQQDGRITELGQKARQVLVQRVLLAPPKFPEDAARGFQTEVDTLGRLVNSSNPKDRERAANLIYRGSFGYTAVDRLSLVKIASEVAKFFGVEIGGRSVADHFDRNENPNARKLGEYYKVLSDRSSQIAQAQRSGAVLGTLGGALADTAAYAIAMRPYTAAVKGIVSQKVASEAFRGSTSARRLWALKNVVPEVADSTRWGIAAATNELVAEVIDNADMDTMEGLKNVGLHFGMGFAGDMLFYGVGRLVKNSIRAIGRSFRGWGDPAAANTVDKLRSAIRSMKAGEVDPNVMAGLPDEVVEGMVDLQRAARVAENVETIIPGSDDHVWLLAKTQGYRAERSGKGWKLVDEVGDRPTLTRRKNETAIKSLLEMVDETTDVSDITDAGRMLGMHDTIRMTERSVVQVAGLPEDQAARLVRQIVPPSGHYTPDRVKTFAREFLRSTEEVADRTIEGITVRSRKNYFSMPRSERLGSKDILYPTRASKPSEIRQFHEDLIERLSNIAEAGQGRKAARAIRRQARQFFRQEVPSVVWTHNLYNPSWVKFAASRMGKKLTELPGGRFRLSNVPRDASGRITSGARNPVEFSSIEEASDWLYQQMLTPDMIRSHLYQEFGLRVNETEAGRIEVRRGRDMVLEADSYEDMWRQRPDLRPKLPIEHAPDLTVIDDTTSALTVESPAVVGNIRDLAQFMDQFKDYAEAKTKRIVEQFGDGTRVVENGMKRHFEVYIPDVNYRREFRSATAAKKWVAEEAGKWQTIQQMALEKGMRTVPYRGRVLVYQRGFENPAIATTIEELKAVLRETPIPEYVKDLSGLDNSVVAGITDDDGNPISIEERIAPEHVMRFDVDLEAAPEVGGLGAAASIAAPIDAAIGRMARETGRGDILDNWMRLEQALKVANGQDNIGIRIVNDLWNRRLPKARDRRLLMEVIQESAGNKNHWDEAMQIREGRNLTDKEREILELNEELVDAISERADINFRPFIEEHFPRVRKWFSDHPNSFAGDGAAQDLLDRIFGGSVPADFAQWLGPMRMSDLVAFTEEFDPSSLYRKLISQTNRRQIVQPVWDELKDLVTQPNTPQLLRERVLKFLDDTMGRAESTIHEAVRTASFRASKRVADWIRRKADDSPAWMRKRLEGLADVSTMDDITTFMRELGYGATMIYRPWLVIRNTFQPWITLAPRVGFTVTGEAISRVVNDAPGQIFSKLRNQGRIKGMPMIGYDETGLKRHLTRKGLAWYKNSDDYTRAVVDQVVEILWDEPIRDFTRGAIDFDEFLIRSGLRNMSDRVKATVIRQLRNNNIDAAKMLYGDWLTWDTMFPYQKGSNPLLFRGVFGRLFGQMGHYPVYYLSNVLKGMRNADGLGQKLAWAGRYATASAALYGIFNEVFGVKAHNFLPWVTAGFTGGPYAQLVWAASQSIGTGFKGDRARDQLKRELPRLLVPGTLAFNSFLKGLEYLDRGYYYEAFLSFGSFPIVNKPV